MMPKPIIFGVGEEFLRRDGLDAHVQPWEDGRRAPTGRGHFEWWYFDAHLEDGSTAVIVFATKPIISPSAPLIPNVSLTITRPNGLRTAEFALPSWDAFSAAETSCQVTIGDCTVRQELQDGAWVYHLQAGTASLAAELTFTGLVPPWRPGAGKSYFGDLDHYFAWLPAVPYGRVSGTLTYDGLTRPVAGSGYHDHNWGNVALPQVLDHWTWGRAHLGGYSLIFVEQIAVRRYGSTRLPVFLLAQGDHILADDARFLRMEAGGSVRHPGGRVYPGAVTFVWERDREKVVLALRRPELIEAVSLLGALPRGRRALARLIANPYYFRFNAELHLEIDLEGKRASVSGPALYELMLLR